MWRFIPVLCVTLAVAVPVFAQPAAKSYELRTYTAAAGRLDELHDRFRQHTIPLLRTHGAEVVGTWVPAPNPDNAVVVLLAYPSAATREAVWSRIVADPRWTSMKRKADGRGLLVEGIDELPLAATEAVRLRGGDLELRTHATREPVTGAVGVFVPARPTAGVAMLSLHPRRPETAGLPQRSLVTVLLAVLPGEDVRVTVLSPTDYSPLR